MPDAQGLLTLEEVKDAVGASWESVRTAIRVLKLEPVTSIADRRTKRYKPEWVPVIRKWIEDNLG